MKTNSHWFVIIFSMLIGNSAWAEPQLYETGPSKEVSYVRFINATDKKIVVVTEKKSAKITLNAKAAGRASRFFSVKSGLKVMASIQSGAKKATVSVNGKPWEYITVVILKNRANKLATRQIKESPTDFNAMRSSLAFFNLDESCTVGVMKGGSKQVTILKGVKSFSVKRRLVNPIKLSATVGCKGQNTKVDLAQLEAGGRYSIFLLSAKNPQQAFFVRDTQ
ncbi:MAG: hypothetical protein R8K48_01875 [Gallionella sp.]